MFCPLTITWGNAADWAAALASTLAVFAAVWIATGQERSAREVRQRARDDAHQRGAHLIAEVIRLAGEIEAIANAGATLGDLGGSSLSSYRDQLEGLRSQLRALQRYPHEDPRVFGEIGRIIHASEFSLDITQASTSYVSIIFRQIAGRMADRRQALVDLQSRDLQAEAG